MNDASNLRFRKYSLTSLVLITVGGLTVIPTLALRSTLTRDVCPTCLAHVWLGSVIGSAIFSIAILFWLTAGTWLWMDRSERLSPLARALRDMGMASLLVFFLHHLVAYRFFWALGWVTGRSWRATYGLFGPSGATALFVLLTGLMLAAARIWIRWRRKMHIT